MSPGDPTPPLWQSGVLGILAAWPAQKTAWAGASFLLGSQGEHRPLQDQPGLGGCEHPPTPHSLLPFHRRCCCLPGCLQRHCPAAGERALSCPHQAPTASPGPSKTNRPWASFRASAGPAACHQSAPHQLTTCRRVYSLATGAPRSSCQPCAPVWVSGSGQERLGLTGGLGGGVMGWLPPPSGVQ